MFLVVDGNSLACTCFFSTSPREVGLLKTEEERRPHYDGIKRSPDGRYVGAVESFFSYVLELLKSEAIGVEEVAFCFDKSSASTIRKAMYPEYKEQRSPKPEPLTKQIETIKQALKDSGFKVYEHRLYEADDIAGSLASHFSNETQVRILTKDKDYLQLVSDSVHVWMMRDKRDVERLSSLYGEGLCVKRNLFEYTEEVVRREYFLTPRQVIDWKAVSGDASDNIPGVKGVSDKTILPLLNRYGSLREIYKEIQMYEREGRLGELSNKWGAEHNIRKGSVAKLWEGRYEASFFQKLVAIKTDIPVLVGIEDFRVSNANFLELQRVATDLGMVSVASIVGEYFLTKIRQ